MNEQPVTPFPILNTDRLTLRQLSTTDAPSIFELRSDSEINKYLDREPSKTIDDAVGFIQKIAEMVNQGESLYWVVTLTESGAFVGTIGLFGFSDAQNTCEIGYELLPRFQGRGIMGEAVEKVLEYATKGLNMQKIEAFTHKDNQNSTRLLTRLGFVEGVNQVDDVGCWVFLFSSERRYIK